MFTAFAIFFIVLILGAIYYSYGVIVRRPPSDENLHTETCSLCRQRFEKSKLVERAVGDTRLFFFCPDCIQKLYDEARQR